MQWEGADLIHVFEGLSQTNQQHISDHTFKVIHGELFDLIKGACYALIHQDDAGYAPKLPLSFTPLQVLFMHAMLLDHREALHRDLLSSADKHTEAYLAEAILALNVTIGKLHGSLSPYFKRPAEVQKHIFKKSA